MTRSPRNPCGEESISSRPIKRSMTISGHRTSVALELEFWHALQLIAEHRSLHHSTLIAEVDGRRRQSESLAGALRVFALSWFMQS